MIENKIDIPKGWASATLAEITSKLVDGSHNPPPKQTDGFPMLSAINIDNNKINFSSYRFITKSSFELEDCRTRIKAGDVLLTIVGAIGRTAIVPDGIKPFTLQRSVAVLTPILVDPKFLMYQLESPDLSNFFMRNARGTAQKGIYLKVLGGTEILIPPLNEQNRIVAKIEELLSELDKGIENLKIAREQLKVYRQAVLKYAFEGKFTTHWREQNEDKLETADQLLERIKEEREAHYQQQLKQYTSAVKAWEAAGKEEKKPKKPEKLEIESSINSSITQNLPILPVGWNWVPLSYLLSFHKKSMATGPFGMMLKKDEHTDSGVPVLGIENIGQGKFVAGNKIFVTQQKASELASFEVESGDVIISRAGTVGEICEVPSNIGKALISTNLLRVSLNSRLITSQFFVFLFQGAVVVKKQVKELCKGSSRDFLNQSILASIVFPLPCIVEQDKVLEQIASRISLVDNLEREIDDNLEKSEALRQSILKKVFSGKLVAQDPNDEPASVLLERIRAEKEAQETESKKPKAKRNAA